MSSKSKSKSKSKSRRSALITLVLFTSFHVSHVTCNVSRVTYHMSCVACHSRSRTQKEQDTVGLSYSRIRTQQEQDTVGVGHSRSRTHQEQDTVGHSRSRGQAFIFYCMDVKRNVVGEVPQIGTTGRHSTSFFLLYGKKKKKCKNHPLNIYQ